jgi:hypothetical protein
MVSAPSIVELAGVVIPESEVTLSQRIDAGKYNWFNDDITEKRFPLSVPSGPRHLVLVHFGKDMSSEGVVKWATDNGYEVSPIDDLLAVGSHVEHKELQRQFPIVALGSSAVVYGRRSVPCLTWHGLGRGLHLHWYDGVWDDYGRFLLRKG